MLLVELMALLAVLTGSAIVVHFGSSVLRDRLESAKISAKESAMMHDELKAALASRDHRRLDDFIVLWGHKLDHATLKQINIARDERFVESNP